MQAIGVIQYGNCRIARLDEYEQGMFQRIPQLYVSYFCRRNYEIFYFCMEQLPVRIQTTSTTFLYIGEPDSPYVVHLYDTVWREGRVGLRANKTKMPGKTAGQISRCGTNVPYPVVCRIAGLFTLGFCRKTGVTFLPVQSSY